MENSLVPINQFNFGDFPVRATLDKNSDPWFIAGDVCKVLGLNNVSMALSRLDDEEKDITTVDTLGGQQQAATINESGLYSLILTSRRPESKTFKRWVTSEVLPAIRKTGSYSLPAKTPTALEVVEGMVAALRQHENRLAEIENRQISAELHLEKIDETLLNASYLTVRQFCQKQGLRVTPAVMQSWGRKASEMSREKGVAIDSTSEGEFVVHKYHEDILLFVCVAKPPTTPGQPPLFDPKGR